MTRTRAVRPAAVVRERAPEKTPEAMVEAFLHDQQTYGGRDGTGATKATVWTYRKLLLENSNAWAQPEPDGCGGSFDQGKIDDYLGRMKNSGIAEETYAKLVRHMKVFTKWAARAYPEDITTNPLAEVSVRSKERVKWIPTRENVDAMLAACEGPDFYDRRLRLMVTLYAGSGLRRAEILGARIEDVNTTTRTITVTRKGGDQQAVPIGLKTIAALRDHLATRPGWQKEDWLITDADGGRIRDDYATKLIRALMKKAGLKECGPHSLRRFFATETAKNSNGNLHHVKEMLGHSTLTMTLRYAKLAGVTIQQNHRRFDPLG